jgi:hypothetical protein
LVLRAAAAARLRLLAGSRVSTGAVEASDQAPPIPQPVVTEAAAARLGRMLTGSFRELMSEWFDLAAQAGAVLPPHWVPVVLDQLGPDQRRAFAPVLGSRASWLAARNPEWSAGLRESAPSEECWTGGTLDERRAALLTVRQLDPSRARQWVERTWSEDPPEARTAFIQILGNGLGPDDEPLLERTLDDRRKSVRQAAAGCLAVLANSAYAVRMQERVRALILLPAPRSGLLGRFSTRKLEVRLPESLDQAAIRDGIEAKPPADRRVGERAWWLLQMVAVVRPAFWCETYDCDAATFVGAAEETEYGADLLRALTEAALRHPHPEWIAALSERSIPRGASDEVPRLLQTLTDLVRVAPDGMKDDLMQRVMRALGPGQFSLSLQLLSRASRRWNAATTMLACSHLAEASRVDVQKWSHPRHLLTEWGTRADGAAAARSLPPLFQQLAPESPWRPPLDQLLELIEFRAAMQQELVP